MGRLMGELFVEKHNVNLHRFVQHFRRLDVYRFRGFIKLLMQRYSGHARVLLGPPGTRGEVLLARDRLSRPQAARRRAEQEAGGTHPACVLPRTTRRLTAICAGRTGAVRNAAGRAEDTPNAQARSDHHLAYPRGHFPRSRLHRFGVHCRQLQDVMRCSLFFSLSASKLLHRE